MLPSGCSSPDCCGLPLFDAHLWMNTRFGVLLPATANQCLFSAMLLMLEAVLLPPAAATA
jgi:hypothetical protein